MLNWFAENMVEIGVVASALTLASVAAFRYSCEEISQKSLNRPITDAEKEAGFDAYKVIDPSRGSKILKLL